MWLQYPLRSCFLIIGALALGVSASSWSLDDATVSIQGKKAGVGGGLKEKYAVVVWHTPGIAS